MYTGETQWLNVNYDIVDEYIFLCSSSISWTSVLSLSFSLSLPLSLSLMVVMALTNLVLSCHTLHNCYRCFLWSQNGRPDARPERKQCYQSVDCTISRTTDRLLIVFRRLIELLSAFIRAEGEWMDRENGKERKKRGECIVSIWARKRWQTLKCTKGFFLIINYLHIDLDIEKTTQLPACLGHKLPALVNTARTFFLFVCLFYFTTNKISTVDWLAVSASKMAKPTIPCKCYVMAHFVSLVGTVSIACVYQFSSVQVSQTVLMNTAWLFDTSLFVPL